MHYFDNQQHNSPHIHVVYQEDKAVIEIPSGTILDGKLPPAKMKLISAWIELRQEELKADWQLALNGNQCLKLTLLGRPA